MLRITYFTILINFTLYMHVHVHVLILYLNHRTTCTCIITLCILNTNLNSTSAYICTCISCFRVYITIFISIHQRRYSPVLCSRFNSLYAYTCVCRLRYSFTSAQDVLIITVSAQVVL